MIADGMALIVDFAGQIWISVDVLPQKKKSGLEISSL
jgi:hypothetical protein